MLARNESGLKELKDEQNFKEIWKSDLYRIRLEGIESCITQYDRNIMNSPESGLKELKVKNMLLIYALDMYTRNPA